MFGRHVPNLPRYYNIWNVWNLNVWITNFEICMWNVWNLKFWELKCLTWDVWILKAKNWNLKSLCETFAIWNFKNWKLKCLNIKIEISEYWKLKNHYHSKQQWSSWHLNTLLSQSLTKTIKMFNKLFYYTLQCLYWLLAKLLFST